MKYSEKKLAFAGPFLSPKEVAMTAQAAWDGWYETFDKYMNAFTEEAKKFFNVKYAIGTHCCTQALHLACLALGLKEGDEVIVQDHSWVATAYAITYTGAKCVFVDVDPQTLCISPEAIEKAVTPATKAIMLVHNFGVPADMDEIMAIAAKYNLKVIEDAAPALGSEYKGRKCGSIGDIGCISFQGGKIAVASEGGVFLTNDKHLYERGVLLSSMGRNDSKAAFWSDEIGYQYTIGSLPAAIATVQIQRADELVANKRRIYNQYVERLADHPLVDHMVKEKPDTFANYTYPSLFLKDEVKISTPEIIKKLKECNIHGRTGFPPMSEFPVYKKDKRFDNKVANWFFEKGIVLPAAHNLTEDDIQLICDNFIELIES
jgi:perosamine synthetase